MSEIYVSIDVESDGPIPGPNSMLSFGAAAFRLGDTRPIATFEANLDTLPGAEGDPSTMEWWKSQPAAWEAHRQNLVTPQFGMRDFVAWIKALPGASVIIGYPVTYDFLFLYWYTMRFGVNPGERSPFGFQGLDLKTLAWMKLGGNYKGATKKNMPRAWFTGAPKHDHTALQDAIGQGVMFVNMMKDGRMP